MTALAIDVITNKLFGKHAEGVSTPSLFLALFAVAVATVALVAGRYVTGRKPPTYVQSIRKEIRIQGLFVHPIKSCRGTSVSEAHFDEGGLRYDRAWLIIDAQSRRFQTVRELPRMVTIAPRMDIAKNTLEITVPLHENGKGSIVVKTPLDPSKEQLSKMEVVQDITIWGQQVDGYAVSNEADEALSQFFGRPVRLVRKGPSLRNAVSKKRVNEPVGHADQPISPIRVLTTHAVESRQCTIRTSIRFSSPQADRCSTFAIYLWLQYILLWLHGRTKGF